MTIGTLPFSKQNLAIMLIQTLTVIVGVRKGGVPARTGPPSIPRTGTCKRPARMGPPSIPRKVGSAPNPGKSLTGNIFPEQPIKIFSLGGGGKPETLRKNDKKSRFYLNQEVQMFEDIRTEFKNFTNLEFKIACNYICGFLNTFGGSLYFGINNDGYVKGINLTRQDIDDFQINLDVNLRKFTPKVFPDKYTLKWHEVASDSSCKKIIANKYVVEIEVKNVSSSGDVYVTGEQCCFIKRSGSLNNLTLAEIM
jgi:hypothetical protein